MSSTWTKVIDGVTVNFYIDKLQQSNVTPSPWRAYWEVSDGSSWLEPIFFDEEPTQEEMEMLYSSE